MTDKLKDPASSLPPAEDVSKKIAISKPAKGKQVTINPPEKVDTNQGGIRERFGLALRKHTVILEKKTELVLQSKAARANLPEEVLKQVFIRGYKNLPFNTELTREQYAINRVNSFIAGGAALQEDFDLIPIMERIGIKGTGGAMRPHIKAERNVYNGRMEYHVVNAKGQVKHTAVDKFAAKRHLAQKYNSYLKESIGIEEAKEKTEYDYEGDMARGQLRSIIANAQQVHDMLKPNTNIAEWVQNKITLSADYISTVADYMQSEVNEEVEQIDELKSSTLGSYIKKAARDKSDIDSSIGDDDQWDNMSDKEQEKSLRQSRTRKKGIDKATDKLTKEDVEQFNELKSSTLMSYLQKVSDQSQKHKMDPTKRSAEKRNKSVMGFSRAFNKLETRKEEVEQIDEISTDGYHKAAVKSRMDAAVKVASSMGKDKQATTKLNARNAGLKRLSDRTSSEMKKANSGPQRPVHREPSSMSSPQAYYASKKPGEYTGDSFIPQGQMLEAKSAAVRFQMALQNAKKKREEEEARNAENVKRALTPREPQEKK
jgi:hypothetical protein